MNRLAAERSPYLLQHAGNPVDWYPWSAEAFEKARREDKPIFLSIGYSTCHWCHVMEHESFEDSEIARILNADYVSIKVDREERPDIDRVYMSFVQATTGSGGWPMSVWLTPELKPFFGGTYFPPRARWGRPGFAEVLAEIERVWKADRARVAQTAETFLARLQDATSTAGKLAPGPEPQAPVPGPDTLQEAVRAFRAVFDRRRGGFGEAPKFPRPSELLFLQREYARTGDETGRDMAALTLKAMALGGMRDHIGGGFHRYSVDAEWRVPHFEKMLYDQAQLSLAYLEAAQATRDPFYEEVAADTLDYVLRDLSDPAGGFYSAEDADSLPPESAHDPAAHKSEGAFYLWSADAIDRLLEDEAAIVKLRFGIERDGNAPQDPQGEFVGKNLLYAARDIGQIAEATGRSPSEVAAILERARRTLFEARAPRPKPHLDDKVLTAWNGLMIAALARASRVMTGPGAERAGEYLRAAERAAGFIHDRMWHPASGLLRRYRAGEAAIDAYCEDYAALIWGLLELVQASGEPRWLAWALALQERQDELFWDSTGGGWFSTSGLDPTILIRLREDYDGAEPSASSIGVMNLLTLAHLTGDPGMFDKIDRVLSRFGPHLGRLARALPLTMAALSMYHAGIQQIVIVGRRDAADTRAMTNAVAQRYFPFAVMVPVDPHESQQGLATLLPFVAGMGTKAGQATAYVCRHFTCQEPVTEVGRLEAQLAGG